MPKFHTMAAYIRGTICGPLWCGPMGGVSHRTDVRPIINRFSEPDRTTFRDVLLSDLSHNGGNFRHARYTADTVLRVERIKVEGNTRTLHVFERPLSALRDCADLVDAETEGSDFSTDD